MSKNNDTNDTKDVFVCRGDKGIYTCQHENGGGIPLMLNIRLRCLK